MKRSALWRASIYSLIGLFAVLSMLVGTLSASPAAYAASAKSRLDTSRFYGARPFWKGAVSLSASGSGQIPPCLDSATVPRCYSPQQIRKAYNIQPLLNVGITGKGRTIIIIDGSSSPTLLADLHLYDLLYGLKDPNVNVIAPFGVPPYDPNAYVETALDVETAHTIAPDATIDLVLGDASQARTPEDFVTAMLKVTRYAIDHNLGDVISQSFGVGESCVSPAYLKAEQVAFSEARAKKITVLASSGDYGAAAISCTANGETFAKAVSVPGSDPLVTSVGGTTLDATVDKGTYVSETTWNDWNLGAGAAGGGFSAVFPRPSYQNKLPGSTAFRGVPDVAYDASPLTGVPIVVSLSGSTLITAIGGTSVGSPAWAGIVALADQAAGKRLGFLNDTFYHLSKGSFYRSAFHDIKTGNNSITVYDNNGKPMPLVGYNAGPGWDAATGLGTPKAAVLVALLALSCDPDD